MISMTGYSYKELVTSSQELITLELKSLNSRYLDINITMPPIFSSLEFMLRKFLEQNIKRGKVEFKINFCSKKDYSSLEVDEVKLSEYYRALNEIKKCCKIRQRVGLSHLLVFEDIIRPKNFSNIDCTKLEELLKPALGELLKDFNKTKFEEGERTTKDILLKVDQIKLALDKISSYSDKIEERIKTNLVSRFNELLGEQVDMQRVYSELSVALAKSTINEEIQRLDGHIKQFKIIASESNDKMVGKPLDFLAQEMNREINTIGSKNFIGEVALLVVNVKDNIEQIREQLRNVE